MKTTETSAGDDSALLAVNNLEVVYNEVALALRGLSLRAERGKVTALLGANGAGKSTALKAISSLLKSENGAITRGDIVYNGRSLRGMAPDAVVRAGIFQVMEGRRIIQDMTVLENLRLGAHANPEGDERENLARVFHYFPRIQGRNGLSGYLSGGEQQMLAIGRALMAEPRMILMDEPSMGLSPLLVREVFGVIRRLNEDLGVTVLLVEQNARMALEIAEYGYVMEQGKVVMDGPVSELRENEDIKEFYLGSGKERKSFKNIKSYKRRKRWL